MAVEGVVCLSWWGGEYGLSLVWRCEPLSLSARANEQMSGEMWERMKSDY